MGSCPSRPVARSIPPPPAMPIPQSFDLPPGWICQFDPQTRRLFYVNTATGDRTWVHPKGAGFQAQDAAMFEGRLRNYEMELAEYNQMYGRGAYSRPPMSQQYGFNNGHSSGGFFGRGGQGGLSKGLMGFLGGSLVGGGIGHAIRPHRPSNTYSDPNQGSGSSFFDNNQGMVGGSTDYLDGGGNTSFFDNNQSMVSGPSDYVGGGRGDSSFFDNNQRVDTGPTDYVGGGGRGDSSFFDNSYGGMDNSRSDFFGGGGGGSSSFFDHVGSSDPAGDFGGGGGSFFDQGGSSSDM